MPLAQTAANVGAKYLPKIISPRIHALIDYATAGSFLLMGALFWKRNKRAALSSMVCAGTALTHALLTDYPGGAKRVISFQTHGKIDAGIVGLTASLPGMMGFDDEPEERFFAMQALQEAAVVS